MTLNDQLIRDEGCRLECYQGTRGFWTIGVGHKLTGPCDPITQEQADAFLTSDIVTATVQIAKALSWFVNLDIVRQDALINMTFNLGIGGLMEFHHFLGYMQEGVFYYAAGEMLNSTWATQVGARADRLATQVVTGVMQ